MAPRLMYLDLASPTEAQKKTTKNSFIHREDPASRELLYHITCPFLSIPTTLRSTALLPCGRGRRLVSRHEHARFRQGTHQPSELGSRTEDDGLIRFRSSGRIFLFASSSGRIFLFASSSGRISVRNGPVGTGTCT